APVMYVHAQSSSMCIAHTPYSTIPSSQEAASVAPYRPYIACQLHTERRAVLMNRPLYNLYGVHCQLNAFQFVSQADNI
ncbi:uncharacterized protein B0H18DRAFT_1041193, partial [Fomitopsis serialis]|uniref:uncharacterized protein n=1 Tax=Fomitopsis serialis TaxID=139415 RepID=UPI002007A158